MSSENDICSVNRICNENIFVENPFTKCGGETIPRTFPKEIKIKYISR